MEESQLEKNWNSSTPDGRAKRVRDAGFTVEAGNKYKFALWDMLPEHIKDAVRRTS